MPDLSIIIPSRNERYLQQTIDDLMAKAEGSIEVIVVLDGYWPDSPLTNYKNLTIIHQGTIYENKGMRQCINAGMEIAKGKYVMKSDGHCLFDQGFDVKLIANCEDSWVVIPRRYRLDVENWKIAPVKRPPVDYQFLTYPYIRTHDPACGLHGDEWRERYYRRKNILIDDNMSTQGSLYFTTRDWWFKMIHPMNVELYGSFIQEAQEICNNTWLGGGRVVVNKKTWYAHMFRTQGGDFSFPYPISGKDQAKAKDYARDLFFNNKWDKQIHPLSWLVEKFWPVKGWTEEDLKKLKDNTFRFSDKVSDVKPVESEPAEDLLNSKIIYSSDPNPSKGIIFCTDNQLKIKIAHAVQKQLKKISKAKGISIVSASLKPMPHFGKNIYFPHLKRGYLAYFTQILGALENSSAEIIFFAEHDVLYPPSHFDFTPPKKDIYYYNQNWWRLRTTDGFAVHWDANQVSGLCAYREHLLKFYRERVALIKKDGYKHTIGFEPGGRNTNLTAAWKSDIPCIDVKHGHNLSKNKWDLKDFRDKSTAKNFTTGYEIPGWGKTKELIKKLN